MKKAIIKIARRDGNVEYLNPSDFRTIAIDQNGTVTVVPSDPSNTVSVNLTRWAIDNKLKPAIKARYNLIEVEDSRPVRKTYCRGAVNSVISVVRPQGSTVLIFPKALVSVEFRESEITVIPTTIPRLVVPVANALSFVNYFE